MSTENDSAHSFLSHPRTLPSSGETSTVLAPASSSASRGRHLHLLEAVGDQNRHFFALELGTRSGRSAPAAKRNSAAAPPTVRAHGILPNMKCSVSCMTVSCPNSDSPFAPNPTESKRRAARRGGRQAALRLGPAEARRPTACFLPNALNQRTPEMPFRAGRRLTRAAAGVPLRHRKVFVQGPGAPRRPPCVPS